jgi:hypothetical protein
MMAAIHTTCLFPGRLGLLGLLLASVLAQPALAYKTERVCEMTEQTAKAKPRQVCKTLLVMTDAQKAATGKEEPKKEEKPAGHH